MKGGTKEVTGIALGTRKQSQILWLLLTEIGERMPTSRADERVNRTNLGTISQLNGTRSPVRAIMIINKLGAPVLVPEFNHQSLHAEFCMHNAAQRLRSARWLGRASGKQKCTPRTDDDEMHVTWRQTNMSA